MQDCTGGMVRLKLLRGRELKEHKCICTLESIDSPCLDLVVSIEYEIW